MAGRPMLYPNGIVYAQMEQDRMAKLEKEAKAKQEKEKLMKGSDTSSDTYGATSDKVGKAVSRKMVEVAEKDKPEGKKPEKDSRLDPMREPLLAKARYVDQAHDAYNKAGEFLVQGNVVNAYVKLCFARYLQRKSEQNSERSMYLEGTTLMDEKYYDKAVQALVGRYSFLDSLPKPSFKD